MGILSFLTGSGKAMDTASNVVDGAISGIDKLWFTDEEKSQASSKVLEIVLERARIAGGESTVRSMTRRLVALAFCIPFVLMSLFAIAIYKYNSEWALFSLSVANSWKYIMISIVIWFFGSYGVGYLMDKKKEKMQ